jgi:dual specificity MAP kinase phosphatase
MIDPENIRRKNENVSGQVQKMPPAKILVHCMEGKSRSATATIIYLMKYFSGWGFTKTLQFVKLHRPTIEPNKGFITFLSSYT